MGTVSVPETLDGHDGFSEVGTQEAIRALLSRLSWLGVMEDTERGEWTGRQLFYALVSTLTFFMALWFIPSALFYAP